LTAILAQAQADLPDLREVVGFSGWQDFVKSASPSAQLPDVRPDDPVQIQYTSGTTGFPKGAILHHRGIANASRFMAEGTGLERGGVWVNAMPMFHSLISGLVMSIEQEVTGPDSLFNDCLSSNHSLLHKIE